MKTEATRAPAPAETSHTSVESRTEAAGPSFPEVLGPRAMGGMPETAAGMGTGPSEPPEGGGAAGFVALTSGVATQAVVATQSFVMRRGFEPSLSARGPRPDPLDPATRQAAQLAPPLDASRALAPPVRAAPAEVRAHASLEEVLPAMVRRIAWSGDGRKGSLRLEFGAGALAGGTLVVHADDGRVKVELHAPSGTDAAAWRDRIAARLEEKKIGVDEIVVE